MTYVLHYAPDNASLIVRLALEELGLPYETRLVDRKANAQQSAAYRSLNPAGLIPVLETPQGAVFETAAILLWLSETHGAMAPPPGDPARGTFLKWLFFTSNTLHAGLRITFYPEKYVGPSAAARHALRSHMQSVNATDMTVPNALAMLDDCYYARLPEAAFDAQPTILDYYVACLLRWCALYPVGQTGWFDIQNYPAIAYMVERLEAFPATGAAQSAEGLGPTPFTRPHYADPLEGSAT